MRLNFNLLNYIEGDEDPLIVFLERQSQSLEDVLAVIRVTVLELPFRRVLIGGGQEPCPAGRKSRARCLNIYSIYKYSHDT